MRGHHQAILQKHKKINPLKPNDLYMHRTTQLTSRCCILYIYSTNIRNEYLNVLRNLCFFLFKMPFIS